MGLQISSYEVENTGIVLENVYIKVTSINLTMPSKNCFFMLSYYVSKADTNAGKMWIGNYTNSFEIPDMNGDVRAQIYVYVKTLPEFASATDLI